MFELYVKWDVPGPIVLVLLTAPFVPCSDQKNVNSWYKRVHSLKFQSLVIPNGFIANLRTHPTENSLCIYGDPAYPLRLKLMWPYRTGDYAGPLTPQMRAFNKAMISVRISLEWLFGDISTYFQFIDFKMNLDKDFKPQASSHNYHPCL